MSAAAPALGELQGLATALGLLDGSGDLRTDWLSQPGTYVSAVLADEGQRNALVAFVDQILGAGNVETDANGLVWLPIASSTAPQLTVYLVLDPAPADHVAIGVGARLTTTAPARSELEAHVPIFQAAKSGHSVPDPILIGRDDSAQIQLDAAITLGTAPPLGGIGLSILVPTTAGPSPRCALALKGLVLPGSAGPTDLNLSLDNAADLENTVLRLLAGLARAEAAAASVPQLTALLGLIGQDSSTGIPNLPLDALASQGARVLATWFESVIGNPAARTAWLARLAALLGASAAPDQISFNIGSANVTFSVKSRPGSGGHAILTPAIAASVTQTDFRASAEADLLDLDMAAVSVRALPSLALFAQIGKRSDGGTRLLDGDPQVDAVRVGVRLDASRRPNLLLAADGVTIAGHPYGTLDLTSPNALAEVGGALLSQVVAGLLAQLGPAGTTVGLLLGITAPPSAPTAALTDPAAFLRDPLGAIRTYWRGLLRDHPAAVMDLLTPLKDLIAAQGTPAVSGAGTAADPWRLPLAGPVGLDFSTASGDTFDAALSARYIADNLGQRCTRAETRLAIGLAHLDLKNAAASFLTSVNFTLTVRPRGGDPAQFGLGSLTLSADAIGMTIGWTPTAGVSFGLVAPNLAVAEDNFTVPVTLPVLGADGSLTLDAAAWDSLEGFIGLLADAAPLPWIGHLAAALGWIPSGPPTRPRLRLADLAVTPATAAQNWLAALALDDSGAITAALEWIANLFTGSAGEFGAFAGFGRAANPYVLPLLPADRPPQLAVWLDPAGPEIRKPRIPTAWQAWTLGSPGLEPIALAQALEEEAAVSDDVALIVSGRPDLAAGFATLLDRWTGSDGRIVPPPSDPAGITVHIVPNLPLSDGADGIDLVETLGSAPATVVHIAVAAASDASPWPNAPAGRLLDLRAPGRAPETFAQPAAATGEWFVALGQRADARLASGDADGIAGQAARLARVLAPFSTLAGGLVLMAQDAAGHAAVAVANSLLFVSAVITIGTPFSPVAFTVLDDEPAADAFRLLRVLLPASGAGVNEYLDLAAGRSLVNSLAALLPFGDPGREIVPAAAPAVPRAGLAVHAFFTVFDPAAVQRAMTAVVAAGLTARAAARDAAERPPVSGLHSALRMPILPTEAGLTVSGYAQVQLLSVDASAGAASIKTAAAMDLHLEVRRVNGWLVGGPGTGLGPGLRPQQELRWLECNLSLPFAAGDAAAEIILHEPAIFGIVRERWAVRPDSAGSNPGEVATPALPEIRILVSLVAEQLNTAAGSSAQVDALLSLLRAIGILDPIGGSVPDAVDHLLHDPAAQIGAALADPQKNTRISSAVATLLTGIPGITVDLPGRRLLFDTTATAGERGMVAWAAHLEATAAGAFHADVSLGSAGTTAAGGAVLRVQTGPLRATLEWHRPGRTQPESIALWPSPDAAGLARALTRLLPAECLRMGLEYVRTLDDTVRPVIDAVLNAIGLLSPAGPGDRQVLLPAGLLHDPIGWFQHESAFGAGGTFDAPKIVALIDALKPVIGVDGDPGKWNLAAGVTAIIDSVDGHVRLGVQADSSKFPAAANAARLAAAGTFTLTLVPGSAPRPGLLISAGVSGAAAGRQAVYVELGDQFRIYLRPATGADIPIYPDPPGLGQLAAAGIQRALPFILDHLSDLTGTPLKTRTAQIVRAVGDGLNLRAGMPARFDGAKLQAWAADPVASLMAALPTLTGAALQAIASALQPVLPAGLTVTAAGGTVTVRAGALSVAWQPSPLQFTCAGTFTSIPGIGMAAFSVVLTADGLQSLTAQAGPANVDAGGVTIRPFLSAAVGDAPAGGRKIQAGIGFDDTGTKFVAARWNLDGAGLAFAANDGTGERSDLEHVALAFLSSVLDLAASFAMRTTAMQQLLANPVGTTNVREVLRGVLLKDVASPTELDANPFDPASTLGRVKKLAVNLAGAQPALTIGGGLKLGLGKSGSTVQATLGVTGRVPLTSGDIVVSLEADSRWIQGQPPAGIALGILDSTSLAIAPSLSANGIGIRIGRETGPLLDLGFTLGSVATHFYGEVTAAGGLSGGVQLQLSDIAAGVANSQGGNPVARGIMADGGSGSTALAPAFSPALAVQKHGSGPVLVSLRAGDGNGPWWVVIQKGFGPIYVEQVGFGVTVEQDQLKKIALMVDGRVSLFGLTVAVDDLQVSFAIASDASIFDPLRWAVDLAGLAITADVSGLSLEGGLRKFGDGETVEYVGMLLGRFGVYGLSVYGSYASGLVSGQRFASFFAFGAVNGPIGGPPAFFITGIAGGLGINRDLIFPSSLARFGEFPFLKALDPSAPVSADPMAELAALRGFFPLKRGEFWFAAGIAFTSFALVDGIAVVSVKIGDELEVALVGLARMALPRPDFALVSIEIGLIARFSSKDGVLLVQAQLTDNSWLLDPAVRLTGGFAYATWFKGPRAGEAVLTMGGYHPHFHRDGYPIVPRLGYHWNAGDSIVIKGESYFALTSEAIMAGGTFQASATFGSAWAEIAFSANGIVYYDPFRFEVEAFAQVSAGVTIDVWIGEITISVSLGAKLTVQGPKFFGKAEFDVGPVTLTVPFGDPNESQKQFLPWDQFVRKYLEEFTPGVARVLTAIPGKGALPPGTGPGGATETGTADGSAAKPFEVYSEFEITVTSPVPSQRVLIGTAETNHLPSKALGIAPVGIPAANSRLVLHLLNDATHADVIPTLQATVSKGGGFPAGVWGPPQPDDDRKVPSGEVISAVDGVRFEAVATLKGTLPKPVKYNQVEAPGPRKPLPFPSIQAARPAFVNDAQSVTNLLPFAPDGASTYSAAVPWLAKGGYSQTAIAALARERSAPPRLGSLTQDLAAAEPAPPNIKLTTAPAPTPVDRTVLPPRAIAVLTSSVLPERAAALTTVKSDTASPRVTAPTLDAVRAQIPAAVAAKLVKVAAPAAAQTATIVAADAAPLTRLARGPVAAVAARGAFADGKALLDSFTKALQTASPAGAAPPVTPELRAGEVTVLQLPNAARDVDPKTPRPRLAATGNARIVALSHAGEVLLDAAGSPQGTVVPAGAERIAVLALGDAAGTADGLLGWHSGQQMAYVGWSSTVGPGVVVRSEGASVRTTRQRFRAGWMAAAELVTGATLIATRFAGPVQTVAILIDDPIGSDAARGLSLGLDGADRARDAAGRPVAPTVAVAGNRSVLVYPIAPPSPVITTNVPPPKPVTVTIASQNDWHIAGVMGGNETPESVAARVALNGPDGLLQPMVPSNGGTVTLSWLPGTPP